MEDTWRTHWDILRTEDVENPLGYLEDTWKTHGDPLGYLEDTMKKHGGRGVHLEQKTLKYCPPGKSHVNISFQLLPQLGKCQVW